MKENEQNPECTGDPVDQVEPTELAASALKWEVQLEQQEISGMLGSTRLARHFDIPLADLQQVLCEMGNRPENDVVQVRAYIGLSPNLQNLEENIMRMYLTGVDADGKSIFIYDTESGIYDFITPCPPTCAGGGSGGTQ